jgi:hypothetical protein
VSLGELEMLAAHALELSTASQVEDLLEDALEARMIDLLTGTPESMPSSVRPPLSSGRSSRGRKSRPRPSRPRGSED